MNFKHSFSMTVCGPSGCGKTEFVSTLVNGMFIEPPVEEVNVCYEQWQPAYEKLRSTSKVPVQFFHGVPENLEMLLNKPRRKLFIFDDCLQTVSKDDRIMRLFTVGSHHTDTSVCCLIQNLYHEGRNLRTINRNTQYLVLFNCPR